jgi:hypothetical protein
MTIWLVATVPVVTVNVAVVDPAAIKTEFGSETAAEFDDRNTTAPPEGAGEERVSVAVTELALAA